MERCSHGSSSHGHAATPTTMNGPVATWPRGHMVTQTPMNGPVATWTGGHVATPTMWSCQKLQLE